MRRMAWLLLFLLPACAVPRPSPSPQTVSCPAWSMEGGGASRTSRTSAKVPTKWTVTQITRLVPDPGYLPEEYSTPIVSGPLAYVGHAGRSFQAVRWKDGTVEWSVPTRGRIYTTAACGEGLLIFGDDQGDVRAVNPQGKEVWKFHVTYPVVASPLVAGGKVYIAEADQNVFCLEAATGRPLWQYGRKFPRHNAIWGSLGLAWGGNRVYAGFSDGLVVALDPDVGRVLWRAEVAKEGLFSDVVAGPSYAGDRVYAGSARGPVVSLEAATGKELWRREREVSSGFAVGDDLLYAATPKGTLLALSRSDGSKAWEVALDGGVPTPPVLAGDKVVVGASRGSLFALDARSGRILEQYDPGPGLHAQPLVFDGGVLFLSNGGALHLLQ